MKVQKGIVCILYLVKSKFFVIMDIFLPTCNKQLTNSNSANKMKVWKNLNDSRYIRSHV